MSERLLRRRTATGLGPTRALVVLIVASLFPLAALASGGSPAGAETEPRPPRFGANTIVDFLAGMAKEPLRNFLFDQIGIKTTGSQLKDIQDKLNQLQGQLTRVEAALSAEINELKLTIETDFLGDTAADLQKLLDDQFSLLGEAIERLHAARDKTPHDEAAIQAALRDVETAKTAFMRQAEADKVTSMAAKIHDRLQPKFTRDGVTVILGKDIMATHRILTTADSLRVDALYDFLEENQALATWMHVEYLLAEEGDHALGHVKRELDDFFDPKDGYVAKQRDGTIPNGQHAPIPIGVAIDRGPDADVNSYTTANKPMFAVAGTGYQWIPTNKAWGSAFEDDPTNIPAVVKRINEQKLRGMGGWSAPSGAQIDGLFSLLSPSDRSHDKISAYLRGYFGDDAYADNFSWTSDSDNTLWGPVHRAWSASDLGKSNQPSVNLLPGFAEPNAAQRAIDMFATTSGGLLAVRSTGQAQYLP